MGDVWAKMMTAAGCAPKITPLTTCGKPRADASPDVHALADYLAREAAERSWRLAGQRTAAEARGVQSTFIRRSVR